ncbi:hypothetical protein EVAR_59570_1 [Eumeta japonica]|uniref:Gustatory receptor n=1 Tax=Eumeta variegata TaxID=151549 RepID=A0A4C1YUD8_EUMVA|nr:hypothetical protein EVAR_59570_1 [Eumeta japonica]
MPGGNEYMVNNAVGEDIQRALRPFDLIRDLLLVSKYRIKDNLITPRPRMYYILSLGILLVFLYVYKDISYCLSYKWCFMVIYALHPVAYATFIAIAAYQSESAIKLVTKMQEIDRNLRIVGVLDLPNHHKTSWCYVICVIVVHASKLILIIIKLNTLSSYTKLLSNIILDLEILYLAFIVDFLLSRLEAWTTVFVNAVRRPNINIIESNHVDRNTTALFGILKAILGTFLTLKAHRSVW